MIILSGSDYPKKITEYINASKKNIDVAVYDWRWYADQPAHAVQRFNNALVQSVKRGVKVRAVVNAGFIVPILKSVGIQARNLKDKRVLHAKFIIIDNKILVIGSHNFTRNAFGSNIETSVIIDLDEGDTRISELFNNLYNI